MHSNVVAFKSRSRKLRCRVNPPFVLCIFLESKQKKKKKVEAYGKVPGDSKGRNKIVSQSPQKEQMPFI